MKIITLITLALLVTVSGKAQSRVDNGQYTSEVSFNWADSVKKYDEIAGFLINTDDDDLWKKYFLKWKFYEKKVDSLLAVEENKKRLKRKSELEKKYHIKLP